MRQWVDPAVTGHLQTSAERPASVGDGPAPFAEGIDRYIALMREQRPAARIETTRLLGDLGAPRFAEGYTPKVRRHDSYIAAPGREIAVRIFDPGGGGLRPALCYFHGGGFAFGSVESFDIVAAGLAEATGALVVSAQYRRLPETDYAGAQADCDEAFGWLMRNTAALGVDPARVGVTGDSAGALLALACAANARDAGMVAPVCQLLFYGTFAMTPARPAYRAPRDPLLTSERIGQYIALFRSSGGLADNPAPLDRTDLSGLPPTHIVVAEHDPLRAEAIEFVARLDRAGVAVSLQSARGMIHGFLRAIGVSAPAREELHRAAAAVGPWLWPGATA